MELTFEKLLKAKQELSKMNDEVLEGLVLKYAEGEYFLCKKDTEMSQENIELMRKNKEIDRNIITRLLDTND